MCHRTLLIGFLKTMEDVSFRYSRSSQRYVGELLLIIPEGVMFGLGMHMLVVPATAAKVNRL